MHHRFREKKGWNAPFGMSGYKGVFVKIKSSNPDEGKIGKRGIWKYDERKAD
jgi:hypothetical protein